MYRILYVDDEPGLLEVGRIFLEMDGLFRVGTAPSAQAALALVASDSFDAIVSDYQMPGMDGIAFLKAVRGRYGDLPFILFTGRGREEVVIEAINNGADFYLQKGGDPRVQFAELAHHVRQAILRRHAERSLVESEKRLSDIINFLPDATFAIDREGQVIAWNRAIEEMTGVSAAEMLGKGNFEYAIPFYNARRKILIDLILEPDRNIYRDYAHIIREKDTLIAETSVPRPKGKQVTLLGKASPLYNREGEIVGAIESIRDITEQKEAEKALNESEMRFRKIFENSPLGMALSTPDFRFFSVNPAWVSMTGYAEEELLTMSFMDLTHPDHLAGDMEQIRNLAAGGIPVYSTEKRYVRKDGSILRALLRVTVLRNEEGGVRYFAAQIEDITERKRAEEELLASEQRYRNVVEDQTEFISRFLPDGTHVFANEAYCRYFGLSRGELLGHRFRPNILPEDRKLLKRFFASLTADHPVDSIEHRIVMPGGRVRWHRWTDRAIFDAAGRITEYQSVGQDITEKKETDIALQESEESFRRLVSRSFDAVIVNRDGRIALANDAAARILGAASTADLVGSSLLDRVHPDFRAVVVERVRHLEQSPEGTVPLIEEKFLRTDGTAVDVEVMATATRHGGLPAILVVFREIGERKRPEAAPGKANSA